MSNDQQMDKLKGHVLIFSEEFKQFGVTRERIRQLQNLALAKMRGALRKKETPAQPSAGR